MVKRWRWPWRVPEKRPPLEFEPSEVDADGYREQVKTLAAELGDGIDEATDHPLDNLINAWTDQWVSEVKAEHSVYAARVEEPLGEVTARLAELDVARGRDNLKVDEVGVARDTAVDWLSRTRAGRDVRPPHAASGPQIDSTDFDDPTLLAGRRPRAAYVHLVALLLGGAADIGAFVQVVELMLPDQTTQLIALIVCGLTVLALYLAHTAGVLLRERTAKVGWAKRSVAVLCLFSWLLLGLLSAWARMIAPQPASPQVELSLDAATAESGAEMNLAGAGMFLALYLGSGLAACLGAYLTHNRAYSAYTAALRAYHNATARSGRTARDHGNVTAEWHRQLLTRDASHDILADAIARRHALSEELKQYARVLFASRGQDPALTDALLQPDKRQYIFKSPSSN